MVVVSLCVLTSSSSPCKARPAKHSAINAAKAQDTEAASGLGAGHTKQDIERKAWQHLRFEQLIGGLGYHHVATVVYTSGMDVVRIRSAMPVALVTAGRLMHCRRVDFLGKAGDDKPLLCKG